MHADSDEARIRALLAAHLPGGELPGARFERLASGGLNRCWRVDTASGVLFVRLADMAARHLGADWASEALLLGIASERGIAPRPVMALPSEGLLVTEFIAGSRIPPGRVSSPECLRRVGALLAELHSVMPVPGIRSLDFAVQAASLESRLPALTEQPGLASRARTVFARLHDGCDRVTPCHNDVHHANLLDDGTRLCLVDWEYGGVGDPIYDIAGFLCHHPLDETATGILVDAYGPGIHPERLRDACWAYDYVRWLWYRLAAETGNDAVSAATFTVVAARLAALLERLAG
jgi:aminoglycoside phosphotransferase (APT) family kinase protein